MRTIPIWCLVLVFGYNILATAGGLRQTVSVSGQTETILKEVKDVKSLVEATRKIQRSGDAATVDLIRLMTSEEYGPAACAVLEKIGRSIVARLIGVMASADTVRAAKAAEILGGIDDPRKFGPLFMALRNEQLASSAVEAIARSKWPEALSFPSTSSSLLRLPTFSCLSVAHAICSEDSTLNRTG